MGLRGPGAKPVKRRKRRKSNAQIAHKTERKTKLSRAERVCRFIERLKITAGMHAGQRGSSCESGSAKSLRRYTRPTPTANALNVRR